MLSLGCLDNLVCDLSFLEHSSSVSWSPVHHLPWCTARECLLGYGLPHHSHTCGCFKVASTSASLVNVTCIFLAIRRTLVLTTFMDMHMATFCNLSRRMLSSSSASSRLLLSVAMSCDVPFLCRHTISLHNQSFGRGVVGGCINGKLTGLLNCFG